MAGASCRSSTGDRLQRILGAMLDEDEFLSPYGIRASRASTRPPVHARAGRRREHRVDYEPAESSTGLFGGNSNWRGPIWFPVNFLLVESLQKFHHYLGDAFTVEFPTGSGQRYPREVAAELSRRLIAHLPARTRRPAAGARRTARLQDDPHFGDLILFHEYFHGDNGAGIGASHQTGWTALVAKLIQQSHESPVEESSAVEPKRRAS